MPVELDVELEWDPTNVAENLERLPAWMPAIVRTHMRPLGGAIERNMAEQVRPHRYKGDLERSIRTKFSDGGYRLATGPTVQRGRLDGGLILELGTKPIPRAPWMPIKRWANFRGMSDRRAYFVLRKIRTRGVSAHPFVDRTLQRSLREVAETGRRIVTDIAMAIVQGVGTRGVRSSGQ